MRKRSRWALARLAIFIVAAMAAGIAGALADAPVDAGARLRVVRAGVSVVDDGAARARRVADTVSVGAGDIIQTDRTGLAVITYADGSLTRLGPSTRYRLATLMRDRTRKVTIGELSAGQAFHRVEKLTTSGSRFEVHTANAVAAVRGTRFATECSRTATCLVAVTEGAVDVAGSSGERVLLRRGQAVAVSPGGRVGGVRRVGPRDRWVMTGGDDVAVGPASVMGASHEAPTPAPGASAAAGTARAADPEGGKGEEVAPTRSQRPEAKSKQSPRSQPSRAEAEAKPEAKAKPEAEAKREAKREEEPKSKDEAEAKPEAKREEEPKSKDEGKPAPAPKDEPEPEDESTPKSDPKPKEDPASKEEPKSSSSDSGGPPQRGGGKS